MTYPIIKTTKGKAVAAAVGGLATLASAVFADDVLDTSEVASVVAGLVTAALSVYAVWRTPNRPV